MRKPGYGEKAPVRGGQSILHDSRSPTGQAGARVAPPLRRCPDVMSRPIAKSVGMNERDKLDRLRGNEVSEELTIGKEERHMAHEERELERDMTELEDAEEDAEKEIEQELRRQHWGHEPERPLRWPNHER